MPVIMDVALGSPPRMRGKVNEEHNPRITVRITPAHAGKSWLSCCWLILPEDHPRACGEKSWKAKTAKVTKGSPPRMRGKAKQLQHS